MKIHRFVAAAALGRSLLAQPQTAFLLLIAALGGIATPFAAQAAETFPARPIRLVVPAPPGAGTDALARLVGEELRAKLGQTVVVENRSGGAGGSITAEAVARSEPNGYTLLIAGPGPLTTLKFLYPKLGYEPSEFVPISIVAVIPTILVVPPNSPFKSVRDLIAYAKANPGKLNYGSGGTGTVTHLAMELFLAQAGVNMQHIAYGGGALATTAALQGQTDVMFTEVSQIMPLITAGRLRALAIGTETRRPSLPDVPTVAETVPGFQATIWFAIVAPPKTPPEVAARLSTAVGEVMKQPNVVAKLEGMNIQPLGSTAAEMKKFMQQETDRWGQVIRTAKITAD